MIGCGSTTITDPNDFRASLPGAAIDLVLAGSDRFRARVTRVDMRHLRLVRFEEEVPRIAFVRLAPAQLFVSFPVGRDALIWNGKPVQKGEIVLHGSGERFHQRTTGACHWGTVSLKVEDFARYSRALLGAEWASPKPSRILRPPLRTIGLVLRLHSQACRLAQARPQVAAHPEVARALEQSLVHALIHCLADDEARGPASARRHRGDNMLRFEQALAREGQRPLTLSELAPGGGRCRTHTQILL